MATIVAASIGSGVGGSPFDNHDTGWVVRTSRLDRCRGGAVLLDGVIGASITAGDAPTMQFRTRR